MSSSATVEAIVLVSGGLDSCVSLAWVHHQGWGLRCLHVTYGQRTAQRERRAFYALAQHFGIPESRRMVVSLDFLRQLGGSALTDTSVPVEDADLGRGGIPSTYVPFRNTHLLTLAASWAEVVAADKIVIGAVEEDSSGYPDCRQVYYDAYNALLRVAAARADVQVVTPVITLSKPEIVRLGLTLNAPLHLTWSCYVDEDIACGRCDSCALRLRGFQLAGAEDPIPYRVRPWYGGSTGAEVST